MRKITVFLLICTLLCSTAVTANALTFQDVSSQDSFYKAVTKLSDIGVIAGRDDGNFSPYDATTRAEFCAFLSRANGYKDDIVSGTVPFRDVANTYWAVNTIYFCYSNGYVTGMGDGTFEPARQIKYEEAVKMVVNAAGVGNDSLLDVGPYWYSGYVEKAQEKGLLKGFTVKSGKAIPRAHVAQLIYNALNKGYFENTNSVAPAPTKTVKPTATVKPTTTVKPTATVKPTKTVTPTKTVKPTATATGTGAPSSSKKPTATATATVRPTVKPEREPSEDGKRIVIDAGHNDKTIDTGAEGNDLKEQDITWKIADRLRVHLERNGFEVIMTRPKKTTSLGTTVKESLQERVDIANKNNADLFISIHCNASGGLSTGTGTETYCYQLGGDGEKLANLVQKSVVKATKLTDRGVKTDSLYVIKHTIMPAILLETGFIDHKTDAALLASKAGQEKFATGIAKAVCEFLEIEYE